MPDFRDLCARMADELDYYRQLLMDDRREVHALATEARAALAEPEPERLTVAQINELPNNGENFIWEDPRGRGWMILDGTFSRDDLQQLADSIPVSQQKDLDR